MLLVSFALPRTTPYVVKTKQHAKIQEKKFPRLGLTHQCVIFCEIFYFLPPLPKKYRHLHALRKRTNMQADIHECAYLLHCFPHARIHWDSTRMSTGRPLILGLSLTKRKLTFHTNFPKLNWYVFWIPPVLWWSLTAELDSKNSNSNTGDN